MKMSKVQAFKTIGWCMLVFAAVNLGSYILDMIEFNLQIPDEDGRRVLLLFMGVITAVEAVFYVLAGIEGIKTKFKLAKAALIGLIVLAVIDLAGIILAGNFEFADLRVILMTAVYAAFLYPAESEEQNRL